MVNTSLTTTTSDLFTSVRWEEVQHWKAAVLYSSEPWDVWRLRNTEDCPGWGYLWAASWVKDRDSLSHNRHCTTALAPALAVNTNPQLIYHNNTQRCCLWVVLFGRCHRETNICSHSIEQCVPSYTQRTQWECESVCVCVYSTGGQWGWGIIV